VQLFQQQNSRPVQTLSSGGGGQNAWPVQTLSSGGGQATSSLTLTNSGSGQEFRPVFSTNSRGGQQQTGSTGNLGGGNDFVYPSENDVDGLEDSLPFQSINNIPVNFH